MDLPDNHVLISAFRPDAPNHLVAKQWLEGRLSGSNSIRLFPAVETGFFRVVTHPKIFFSADVLRRSVGVLECRSFVPHVGNLSMGRRGPGEMG